MCSDPRTGSYRRDFSKFQGLVLIGWTGLLALSATFYLWQTREEVLGRAESDALVAANSDMEYRRWVTMQRGVYVPVSESTPQNPLLSAEASRDVETPSGEKLTLLSPDQMTRQVHLAEGDAVRVRLVSLDPLSEEGVADDWETKALQRVSEGSTQYSEVVEVDGESHLRLLTPVYIEAECLSCHVEQAYQVGDFRGGISMQLLLGPYWSEEWPIVISVFLGHLMLWLVGGAGVLIGARTLKRRADEKDDAVRLREESEAFLQSVIDCTPDPLMVLDHDGKLVLANTAARATRQGKSASYCFEISHSRTSMCAGDEHPCPMTRVFLDKVPVRVEHVHYDEDGLEYPVEVVAAPIFDAEGNVKQVVESCRDIRERKQNEEARHLMQERMLEAQKLESLGVLAGGIAHDFNNILVAILGNAEIALMDVTETASTRGNLRDIKSAAKRAADLCSQLLAYSGKGKFVIDLVDLSALIEEMKGFLEMSVGKKTPLCFELFVGLAAVEADPTQMRQIIMNLVINAAEAQKSTSSPVTVRTSMTRVDDVGTLEGWQLNEVSGQGEFVLLEVKDEGVGMNPETLKRVFEPFFTTKFTGRGLGMAAVLGIVRSHKGAIQVFSQLGKGTVIRVLLPARAAQERKAAQPQRRLESVAKGAGTVLLVDDEADVLRMVTTLLKRLGFDVVTARDGNEAIEVFRAHKGEIVTIVLDLTMPNTDGVQCLESLRKIDTTVPVIISSGYSAQEVYSVFNKSEVADFIQKPFGMERLSEAMALALGKRPPV